MFELYKSEIIRLKLWIILPMLAYLLLNVTSIYFGEYADSGLMIGNVHSVIFALVSLLMGLVQFHKHTQERRWLYLINRPASHVLLCLVLVAAAATISFIQFALTDLLITMTMDFMSPFVIEQRHYHQAIFIFLLSMSFYLAGAYIQLCHSRGAFLVLTLPIFLIASLLLGGPSIVLSLFTCMWLLLLVLSVFKANLNNNDTPIIGKFLAAIPCHLGLFLVSGMILTFSLQMKNLLIDGAGVDIPWNKYFADDTYQHVIYLDGNEKMLLNIQNATAAIQQQYAGQLEHVKTVAISPEINALHSKNLLPYQQRINQLTVIDKQNLVNWVFSFDQMLFISQQKHSLEAMKLGILDENGQITPFNTPPIVKVHSGISQIITPQRIYFYDADLQQLIHRFSVSDDETILSGLYQTDSMMSFISTKNLYLFDTNKIINSNEIMSPDTVIKIPGAYENLTQIDLSEMMDGTMVSMLFGKNSTTGRFPAEQVVIEVASNVNQYKILATRSLEHGFSEVYYHMGWLISPLTNWLYQHSIKSMLKADAIKPVSAHIEIKLSDPFKLFILLITLAAVALTIWCSKYRCKSSIERWSWVSLTCLTGIIGLLTFILFSDKIITPSQQGIEKKS